MTMRRRRGGHPRRILMIKGHSAGIGDILRGSAAWRALRNKFPEAQLFLLMLTREPGYVSESLISRHHLLKRILRGRQKDEGSSGMDKVPFGSRAGRHLCRSRPHDRFRASRIEDFPALSPDEIKVRDTHSGDKRSARQGPFLYRFFPLDGEVRA